MIILLLLTSAVYGQKWEHIKALPLPRAEFGVCRLDDGKILISGGYQQWPTPERSTFVYDPDSNTWKAKGMLKIARWGAPIVALTDGRLFCPSGRTDNSSMTLTSEIYTPSTETWTLAESLVLPRLWESAITLPNGKVLIVGGMDAETKTTHASCELYDPESSIINTTGDISHWQTGSMLFLDTPRNKVIMLSGYFPVGLASNMLSATEEYDIASGIWTVVAHPNQSHFTWPQQSIQLPNGDILVPSGISQSTVTPLVEIYTPSTKTWRTLGMLPHPRWNAASLYIGNDSVLITGGYSTTGRATTDCRMINVKTGEITQAPSLQTARYLHRADVRTYRDTNDPQVEVTEVFVFGGHVEEGIATSSCEKIAFRRPVLSSSVRSRIEIQHLRASIDLSQEELVCIDNIESEHTVALVNALGQVVFSKNLSAFDHRVEVSTKNLVNGLYIFRATTEKSVLSAKVLLNR